MREFSDKRDKPLSGIHSGMHYSQFSRLAVFVENKHGITSVSLIQNFHVYELLKYMRSKGFKDSTLKYYLTAIRQVYKEQQHLFSEDFNLLTNASYEKYRQDI